VDAEVVGSPRDEIINHLKNTPQFKMSTNKESTLTTPSDRDPNHQFRLDQNVPPLSDTQTTQAIQDLVVPVPRNYPQVERRYADPPLSLQRLGLISFIPAKGATPNGDGIYGFAKLRGNFENEIEANERAEYLIRNVDSYHQIFHTYVGRPFPLTLKSEFSKEVADIDLKKSIAESMSADVKNKRDKEQKEIEEIQARQKELLEDVKKTEEALDDRYTTLKVKKAQLVWTYVETEKKVSQMRTLIAKARRELEDLDRSHPELKDVYYNKYVDARKQAGLPVDPQTTEQSFMRYLVEDLRIPEIEEEYNKLFGNTPTQ